MARQTSIFQFEGTIGDLCFYKTKHGYLVRSKGGVSKKRIKNDPAYERVRENNGDFKRAAQAGKLFRNALRSLLQPIDDKSITNRVMSTMTKVIQADQVNPRGQRTVKDGDVLLLEGFQCNGSCPLGKTLHAPFTAHIDRPSGRMIVDIPTFSPAAMIASPEGATHFRLFSGGAAIDFEKGNYDLTTSESAYLPITRKKTGPIVLLPKVTPGALSPLFLLLGIEFSQLVNGKQIALRDGGFNALAVVKVANLTPV